VALEVGSKRVFASAVDWPGWCRSAKSEELALDALAEYFSRYGAVARTAGVLLPKDAADFRVGERVAGSATTDFGAPGSPVNSDAEPMTAAEMERMCSLVEATWKVFDLVVRKAPSSLRKGPRGGGRDRDAIVDHVLDAEAGYSSKLGLKLRKPSADRAAVAAHRQALLAAFRSGAGGKALREGGWSARYAARRIAWHAMDHAWEIEDRSSR
jgi:hypothetical protein